jgi:F-type H+-transporting ATPase subunit b
VFAAHDPIQFETAPDLVSGIELTTVGQKICWSIADYLDAMEQGVGALIQAKTKPGVVPEHRPKPKAAQP